MARKVKLKVSSRLLRKKTRRNSFSGTKHCKFCSNKNLAQTLDYKNAGLLRTFITERGKILASRISGTCSKDQRILTNAIKNARIMALLPYSAEQF